MVTSAGLGKLLQMFGIKLPPLGSIEIGEDETIYFTTHDQDPVDLWMALRSVVDQTGYWPLLTGDESILENRLEWLPETAQGLLRGTATLDERSWLDHQIASRMNWVRNFREQVAAGISDFEPKPRRQFELPYQYQRGYLGSAAPLVVLVPTVHGWQMPRYLCFGSFNHCPSPEENTCILRYWHERYESEFMCMTHDALELFVRKPPERPADAFALACDQYGYCHDMHQIYWPLDDHASRLLGGASWFFWWD
jgi:hypothetical protein